MGTWQYARAKFNNVTKDGTKQWGHSKRMRLIK